MDATLVKLTYGVPYFVVSVAGITYAIVQWRRHPRLSLIITIALGISMLRLIAFDVLWPAIAQQLGHGGYNYYGNTGLRLLSLAAGLCSHVLLIMAAFFGFYEASHRESCR